MPVRIQRYGMRVEGQLSISPERGTILSHWTCSIGLPTSHSSSHDRNVLETVNLLGNTERHAEGHKVANRSGAQRPTPTSAIARFTSSAVAGSGFFARAS